MLIKYSRARCARFSRYPQGMNQDEQYRWIAFGHFVYDMGTECRGKHGVSTYVWYQRGVSISLAVVPTTWSHELSYVQWEMLTSKPTWRWNVMALIRGGLPYLHLKLHTETPTLAPCRLNGRGESTHYIATPYIICDLSETPSSGEKRGFTQQDKAPLPAI